jgi:hypothetical protein
MLKFVASVLLLAIAVSCSSPEKENSYAIIKGKITGFTKDLQEVGLITGAVKNGLKSPNYYAPIDKEGNYQFKVSLHHPKEVRIVYGYRTECILLLHPGDEVHYNFITYNYVPQDSAFKIPENWIKKAGKAMETSEKMNLFNQVFKDSFGLALSSTMSYALTWEFKNHRKKITERIRKFRNEFIEKEAKNNHLLQKWITNHSEYRIAMDYMRYAFKVMAFNKSSPDLKSNISDSYFDFWEEFPIDNPEAINTLNYQNYLVYYRRFLMANLASSTVYNDCKTFPNCNVYELEIEELSNKLKGKVNEFAMAQQVDFHLNNNSTDFLEKGYPLYQQKINDSLIIASIEKTKADLYTPKNIKLPQKAMLYQSDASGEQILSEIAKKHTRHTLLYFWSAQRPIIGRGFGEKTPTEEIWKKFDTLGLDLVLLAHHSPENSWKEKIAEYGLINDLWLLNEAQYEYFEHQFSQKRRLHRNYDKILYKKDFMLIKDPSNELITFKDIGFRETSFYHLNWLPNYLKWTRKRQLRKQIISKN